MITKRETSTKQQILEILKKENRCSIKDIMEHFTISEIAVRRHLSDLEQQGFIRRETFRQAIGRPYYVFELTEKGHKTFPNQYEQLFLEFLDDLEEMQGKKAVDEVLAKRMEREKETFRAEIATDDFDKRIEEFVQIQNEAGFIIDYRKLSSGDYELSNYHCPILNIASRHRQLCRNEKEVIADIFKGSEVKPKSCIAGDSHYCQWKISNPNH